MDDNLKALSRTAPGGPNNPAPPRRMRLREGLSKAIPYAAGILGIGLLFLVFGDRLLPAAPVSLEPVVTLPAQDGVSGPAAGKTSPSAPAGEPFTGQVLFQASGWFEADPFPHRATALASGVVETVHVLEGQAVQAGEPIATLIREDAELRLQMAEASLEAARASLAAAESDLQLARARVTSMEREIAVAHARREELADLADRARELGSQVLSKQDIIQARLRVQTHDQSIAALQAQLEERKIETERLAGIMEVRRGQLAESEVRLGEARLAHQRTVIPAPVSGIIQRLMVSPGQKKVLMADHPESATVALLFQPEQMQARIDVPLSEAARLSVGQAVLLESEFLPDTELRGWVQRIVGEADLQRNTLQAKVRIEDPPPGLRPEILCRAKFLETNLRASDGSRTAGSGPASRPQPATGLQVLVPRSALIDAAAGTPSVWVADESGRRVVLRQLTLGTVQRDGYVAVRDGLRPGDRVVVNPSPRLRDGLRIKPERTQ